MDADILSTALFVMGRDRALAYARSRGYGLYLVDDRGGSASVTAAGTPGVVLEEVAEPTS
jgi:thiamine biosynthesis lipoprotein ApbE